ncbi:putative Response regulator [Gammaproteobacteria bacterium]
MMDIGLSTKTILVVDDMSTVRSALRHLLNALGAVKIDLSGDGDDALRRMASVPYDIILCDYILGEGRDGMQVLEEAKQRQLIGLSTVFAIITGESSLAMVLGAMEYRPDEYIIKPVTRQGLEERLERLMTRKVALLDVERAVRENDIAKVITLVKEKTQSQPIYALDLLRVKSELLLRMGQFEAAGESFEMAGKIRETFWVKLGQGQVRYYLGDYVGASKCFQGLIAENRMHTEAYDWMARVHQAMGNSEAAKEVLATAAQISPRSILRAQALGALSLRAGDIAVAEQAYRSAVRLGRFSIHRDPSDNAHLSGVFMERGNSKEATKTIKEAKKQYLGDPKAVLVLAIAEASAYQQLGLKDAATKSILEASTAYQTASGDLPPDLAISLAKLCHTNGQENQAKTIMSDLVHRHLEDGYTMTQAKSAYGAMGMAEEGDQLISNLWKKVALANNEGVRLVREGHTAEATAVLEQAAQEMPNNPTINMNAARVLLLSMEKSGRRLDLLARAKEYLDRVPTQLRDHNDKFQRLRGAWVKLANQLQ